MQRFIALVLGKQGAGKSTLLFSRLVPFSTAPVFILDTMGDVSYGVHFDNCLDLARNYTSGINCSGVYVLNASEEQQAENFFRTVEAISKASEEKITVVVDEVDKYCSVHGIEPTLDRMIRYGRRDGVNLLFAARRTSEVNPQIRAQADCIISLVQDMPNDIKALKQRHPRAEIVKDLGTFRNTGIESEFVIIGTIPPEFIYLGKLSNHVQIEQHESETLN